jgi:polyphosphate kinase 2 (PPK2 family)
MDACGKDGTIKHVMSGLNPQGCEVHAFKRPTEEELEHNFLWRYAQRVPARGRIGIFNRSYYEDVLVVRVHPEQLARGRSPAPKPTGSLWHDRFEDINNFEPSSGGVCWPGSTIRGSVGSFRRPTWTSGPIGRSMPARTKRR